MALSNGLVENVSLRTVCASFWRWIPVLIWIWIQKTLSFFVASSTWSVSSGIPKLGSITFVTLHLVFGESGMTRINRRLGAILTLFNSWVKVFFIRTLSASECRVTIVRVHGTISTSHICSVEEIITRAVFDGTILTSLLIHISIDHVRVSFG